MYSCSVCVFMSPTLRIPLRTINTHPTNQKRKIEKVRRNLVNLRIKENERHRASSDENDSEPESLWDSFDDSGNGYVIEPKPKRHCKDQYTQTEFNPEVNQEKQRADMYTSDSIAPSRSLCGITFWITHFNLKSDCRLSISRTTINLSHAENCKGY